MLYSVFRIGDATNNLSWQSYQEIASHPNVAWNIPITLGDSHRGYRVLGTNTDYFKHYRYGRKQPLNIDQGAVFSDLFDAVIGAEVARKLGYQVGDSITVAHGVDDVAFARHENKPFTVSAILSPTGTPVDQTIHVSLEAIEAIHSDWIGGRPQPGFSLSADQVRLKNLEPTTITAFLVGLKSRTATFKVQRYVNEYTSESLSAVIPGVALSQLWGIVSIAESALLIVSSFVVVVGLFGMLTTLLTSLNERRREMAILRSVGARPVHIFSLIVGEAIFLTTIGIALGLLFLLLAIVVGRPIIEAQFGIQLALNPLSMRELALASMVMLAGFISGLIPAFRAYYLSLSDGLSLRV